MRSGINMRISSKKLGLQYDPDDVDIRLEHFTVEEVVKLIELNKLEITEENDLQRLGNLWDDRRKSLLIESLMIKLPLPIFYFDGSDKIWQVIDGLQRLTTLFQFISTKYENNFHLKELEYLAKPYINFSFLDLPLSMRRRILDSPIEAYVINPGTPLSVKYNIFNRINTLGLRLKMQEVRNAIFRGTSSNFTKELANESDFLIATNGKVSIKRMDDREYVARFASFHWFFSSYNGDMDDFLRRGMLQLAESTETERAKVKDLFLLSMRRAHNLFGKFCFYRIELSGTPRGRTPNKALFDTLSWNLAKLSEIDYNKLLLKKEEVNISYILFLNDIDFYKSIGDTTSSKTNVNNRFNLLEKFFHNQR
jgi:hypothetical protein